MKTGGKCLVPFSVAMLALALQAGAQEDRPPEDETNLQAGRAIYDARCAACHGIEGDGAGLAAPYLSPPPRDFTGEAYKLRSTVSGAPPLEADLFRTITRGIPGTPMTSWQEILSKEERWQVVYYIKTFTPELFEEEPYEEDLVALPTANVVADEATLARGQKLFETLKCWECHGYGGKGNGPSSRTNMDEFGNPMWPANLTRPDLFRGGSGIQDIARGFITGLDTTPMPSYIDYFNLFATAEDLPEDQEILKAGVEENALALAHYVMSLGREDKPRAEAQQILVDYIDGPIPDDPDSADWDKTEGVILNLSAQLTLPPRWQFANIDRLLVDALYNETELGILVQWDDRTEDRRHGPDDYAIELRSASVALPTRDDLAALRQMIFADAVSIQFPAEFGGDSPRPFFAMGAPQAPVESWQYRADRGGERFEAHGFYAPPEEVQKFFTNAKYDDGRWKVVFKIPIAGDERFTPGRYLPIAFAAWDGANGESGTRCAISSWYWFLMKPQATATPYLYALAAFAAVVAGQFYLIKTLRASRQESAVSTA